MSAEPPKPKRGRPATGKTKVKLGASVTPALLESAKAAAIRDGLNLSQFISRAIQNELNKP